MGTICVPAEKKEEPSEIRKEHESMIVGLKGGPYDETDNDFDPDNEEPPPDEDDAPSQLPTAETYSRFRPQEIQEIIENKENQEILTEFEQSVLNKDYINAMALIQQYSDVAFFNHRFENGDNALIYGTRLKRVKFVYFLLQNGMNTDQQNNKSGDTALHVAVRNGDIRLVTVLMKFKCKLDIKNFADKTPYDIAVKSEEDDILGMFEDDMQAFLHESQPTVREYKSVEKACFGKNKDAVGKAIDAFSGTENPKEKKPKKIWKANSNANITENENESKKNENGLKPNLENPTSKTPISDKSMETVKAINKMNNKSKHLPKLKGWLQKLKMHGISGTAIGNIGQKGGLHRQYLNRYCFVKDGHMIWNDKKIEDIDYKGKLSKDERQLYNECLSFLMIKDIRKYDSKQAETWKFEIIAHDLNVSKKKENSKMNIFAKKKKERVYRWKAKDEETRDKWVNGLKAHWESINEAFDEIL